MISLHLFFCTLRASCLVNLVGRIFKGILDFTNMSLQDLFSDIHASSVSFLYLTESNAKNSQFHSNQKLMGTLICSFEKVSGVTQPSMIQRSLIKGSITLCGSFEFSMSCQRIYVWYMYSNGKVFF